VLFAFLFAFVEKRRKDARNRYFGRLPFFLEIAAVLACVAVMSLLVFVTHNNYGPTPWSPSDVKSVLWNVFARPLWTVCIGVLVHLYSTGHGLLFSNILGAHLWTPLARLTYSAYLYHPVVMFSVYFSMKDFIHYDAMTMTIYTIAFGVIAYLVAFGSFLLIERPLVNLEKMIFPQHR
jgi:peptidoglycan/LPS O-acetylase OafA/YrhL